MSKSSLHAVVGHHICVKLESDIHSLFLLHVVAFMALLCMCLLDVIHVLVELETNLTRLFLLIYHRGRYRYVIDATELTPTSTGPVPGRKLLPRSIVEYFPA